MSSARILVTAGPAREPIDAVRWMTNLSTGNLGRHLCEALAAAGFEVTCLFGTGATVPPPRVRVLRFDTNASLIGLLRQEAQDPPATILHAAALCDYLPADGALQGKVRSGQAEWTLRLVPAPKVIALLRDLFSQALLVGWKYEVEGDRASVIQQGREQLASNRTDACVLNGPAWGTGFGFLDAQKDEPDPLPDLATLCDFLVARLRSAE